MQRLLTLNAKSIFFSRCTLIYPLSRITDDRVSSKPQL